jgi:hypothetical protein
LRDEQLSKRSISVLRFFLIRAGKNALVCLVAVKVVKLTHAIARILEREKFETE